MMSQVRYHKGNFKSMNLDLFLILYTKTNLKFSNLKATKTTKILEENPEENLCDSKQFYLSKVEFL